MEFWLQVFTVIEAMADGAVKQGVPRQMALQFAAQTVLGAAKTVLQTEKHPAILRDEVCAWVIFFILFFETNFIIKFWHFW